MAELTKKTFTPKEIRFNLTALFPTRGGMVASGQNLDIGTVMGVKTGDGLLYPYDNAHSDGTEVAVGILRTVVNSGTTGENRDVDAAFYVGGSFTKAALTGWDAEAAADLGAVEVLGDEIRF